MSVKMKRAAWLICSGCGLFFVYGMTVVFMSEVVAAYNLNAVGGGSLAGLGEGARGFMSDSVMLLGLEGAGLSICSGALFWIGLSQRKRWIFVTALIGGAFGVASLLTVHMAQKAWVLFIADNVCLNVIGLGFMLGGKELRDFILGRDEEAGEEG